VERVERGGLLADDGTLFDRAVFKTALAAVSNTRLSGTIYAEYDDLKPYIAKLEGQKTEQTLESLRSTWGVFVADAERLVQQLVDIGFFQKKSSRQ
jgi:Fic family protein